MRLIRQFRALILDSDLLIFDEATSNLDTISEKQIHGIIENIKTKKSPPPL